MFIDFWGGKACKSPIVGIMLSVLYVFPKIKRCGKEGWAIAAGRVNLLSSYKVWPSGICPYVSTTPQKTGVREGRTQIKGEGRKQKGEWGRGNIAKGESRL